MKTVSDNYKTSMASPLRERSCVRITLDSIDWAAAQDGAWVSNGAAPYADLGSMDVNVSRGDPPATLELNYWTLDGSFGILPDDADNQGFVSSSMSDEDGDCDIVLLRPFNNNHSITAWSVYFDTRAGEWPVSTIVQLETEMEVSEGVTDYVPMDTVTLENLTEPKSAQMRQVVATDMIAVNITKTLPYRRVRVETFIIGLSLEFGSNDIIETQQSHDVDPLSRRLPQEMLSFTVIDFQHRFDPENPAGIYDYVYTRSPVLISFGYEVAPGVWEWLKGDRYLLNSRPIFDTDRVTFSAGGLLAGMTGNYYRSALGTKTLYDMAIDVLQDAAAQKAIPSGAWDVDSSLNDMSTDGVLPVGPHSECLQIIAHAARCILYTDDDNVIHIEPFTIPTEADTDFRLDYTTISEKSQRLSKTDLLKAVKVSEYSMVDGAEQATVLYQATTTETKLHVEFGLARDVTVTVSDDALISSDIYAQAVDLVLASGSKFVEITGVPLVKTETIHTVDINPDGETDSETNPLITSDTLRDALAVHAAAYLSLRNTYEVSYRGNPELESKDTVMMQTRYSGLIPLLVLKNSLSFTGALSGGITGKGLI